MSSAELTTRSREAVDTFLASPRVLVVGLSRSRGDFSHAVAEAFLDRGTEIVPVNDAVEVGDTILDRVAWPSPTQVPDPPRAALIMVPPAHAADAVDACAEAGVTRVWLHRGAGAGSVTEAAIAAADRHGLEVVAGHCPLMFLDGRGVHGLHARFKRWAGTYPVGAAALARPAFPWGRVLAWGLALFGVGWLNGAFRELVLRPLVGEVAMTISIFTLLAVTGVTMAWLVRHKVSTRSLGRAWLTGATWAVMVAVLEMVAFGVVGSRSLDELLAMYDLTRDPSWTLILTWTVIAPPAVWAWDHRRRASPTPRPA